MARAGTTIATTVISLPPFVRTIRGAAPCAFFDFQRVYPRTAGMRWTGWRLPRAQHRIWSARQNAKFKVQLSPVAVAAVCRQAGAGYPEAEAGVKPSLALIADRYGRKRAPGDPSRTCIVCSRSHSDFAGNSPRLVQYPCLPLRQSKVPCLHPPRRPPVRRSLRRQQRQQRCQPRRCQPRSL